MTTFTSSYGVRPRHLVSRTTKLTASAFLFVFLTVGAAGCSSEDPEPTMPDTPLQFDEGGLDANEK